MSNLTYRIPLRPLFPKGAINFLMTEENKRTVGLASPLGDKRGERWQFKLDMTLATHY